MHKKHYLLTMEKRWSRRQLELEIVVSKKTPRKILQQYATNNAKEITKLQLTYSTKIFAQGTCMLKRTPFENPIPAKIMIVIKDAIPV